MHLHLCSGIVLMTLLLAACQSESASAPPRPEPLPPAAPAPAPAPVPPPAAPAAAATVRELSQYGITWTFAEPVQAGRYVTGDWWVVGPVTVSAVTPVPAPGRNGSVVDPPAGDKHGYDERIPGYDAALAVVFPLSLAPGRSLVSTASVEKVGERTPDATEGELGLLMAGVEQKEAAE